MSVYALHERGREKGVREGGVLLLLRSSASRSRHPLPYPALLHSTLLVTHTGRTLTHRPVYLIYPEIAMYATVLHSTAPCRAVRCSASRARTHTNTRSGEGTTDPSPLLVYDQHGGEQIPETVSIPDGRVGWFHQLTSKWSTPTLQGFHPQRENGLV